MTLEKKTIKHLFKIALGLEINSQYKAFPFSELAKMAHKFNDHFADRKFAVYYNPQHQTTRATNSDGNEIPAVMTFWFVWYAFHPQTLTFRRRQEISRKEFTTLPAYLSGNLVRHQLHSHHAPDTAPGRRTKTLHNLVCLFE